MLPSYRLPVLCLASACWLFKVLAGAPGDWEATQVAEPPPTEDLRWRPAEANTLSTPADSLRGSARTSSKHLSSETGDATTSKPPRRTARNSSMIPGNATTSKPPPQRLARNHSRHRGPADAEAPGDWEAEAPGGWEAPGDWETIQFAEPTTSEDPVEADGLHPTQPSRNLVPTPNKTVHNSTSESPSLLTSESYSMEGRRRIPQTWEEADYYLKEEQRRLQESSAASDPMTPFHAEAPLDLSTTDNLQANASGKNKGSPVKQPSQTASYVIPSAADLARANAQALQQSWMHASEAGVHRASAEGAPGDHGRRLADLNPLTAEVRMLRQLAVTQSTAEFMLQLTDVPRWREEQPIFLAVEDDPGVVSVPLEYDRVKLTAGEAMKINFKNLLPDTNYKVSLNPSLKAPSFPQGWSLRTKARSIEL